MARLLYNSNNEQHITNRADLFQFATPAPLGRMHRPVGFGEWADLVATELDGVGVQINTEEYAVSNDGGKMFGLMSISPMEGELITSKEWELLIGLRGSNDQSVQRGLTIGTRVMVCSNLCFSGDLGRWQTKQTTHINSRLPAIVRNALSYLPAMADRENARHDKYKLTTLRERACDAALVEIYRRDGMTAAQLGRAVDELHNPTYAEHAADGYNVWRTWNAVTEALKPSGNNFNHELLRQRSQVATKFFDEVVGL